MLSLLIAWCSCVVCYGRSCCCCCFVLLAAVALKAQFPWLAWCMPLCFSLPCSCASRCRGSHGSLPWLAAQPLLRALAVWMGGKAEEDPFADIADIASGGGRHAWMQHVVGCECPACRLDGRRKLPACRSLATTPLSWVMLQMVPSLALDPRLRRQMGVVAVNQRINGINY